VTPAQECEIAEAVLRTRRWAFREALPEILRAARRVAREVDARAEERCRAADRMIRDYRRLIRCC
jgi:hypothetical protein